MKKKKKTKKKRKDFFVKKIFTFLLIKKNCKSFLLWYISNKINKSKNYLEHHQLYQKYQSQHQLNEQE